MDLLDTKHCGPPDYFVSHRWGANFHALLTSIRAHFQVFEEDGERGARMHRFWFCLIRTLTSHLPSQPQLTKTRMCAFGRLTPVIYRLSLV